MKNFMDLLIDAINRVDNPTVMGLDPNLDFVPEHIVMDVVNRIEDPQERAAEMMYEFNRGLLEAVQGVIPAVKPQLAYYEMYGAPGVEAFARTCRLAKAMGYIVIADGKRNDIGSTAACYAKGYLSAIDYPCGKTVRSFESDALTVNPYLGQDGIAPFMESGAPKQRGAFALLRTSNPSSRDLQDLQLADGRRVYEAVADLLDEWGRAYRGDNGYSALGAVVGATWPEQAAQLRQQHPHLFFLVPGYGAQGGDASSVRPNFDRNGQGAIINASRSLIAAWQKQGVDGKDYREATLREAKAMRDAIKKALSRA